MCVFITVVVVVVVTTCYSILILSNDYVFVGATTQGAVLPILMPGGILLTRLLIGVGVHVTQVVSGTYLYCAHACVCRCACDEDHYVPHADGGTFVRVSVVSVSV